MLEGRFVWDYPVHEGPFALFAERDIGFAGPSAVGKCPLQARAFAAFYQAKKVPIHIASRGIRKSIW
jgi:hypothetical protein